MKAILSVFFLLNVAFISGQDINTQVSRQVSAIRSGSRPEYRALEQTIDKSPEAVLKALAPFQTDTSGA